MRNWLSSSRRDPKAIYRKLSLSLIDGLVDPSAIFEVMEIAALRIWFVREKTS